MAFRDSDLTWVVNRALASLLQLVRISDLGVKPLPPGEEEPAGGDKGEVGGVLGGSLLLVFRPSGRAGEGKPITDKGLVFLWPCLHKLRFLLAGS